MTYQRVTGSLCARMAAGYCGQDAYDNMLVTEKGNNNVHELAGGASSPNLNKAECRR